MTAPEQGRGRSPRQADQQLRRRLVLAAVRENEALLGRLPTSREAHDEATPRRTKRRLLPFLLALAPLAVVALLAALTPTGPAPDADSPALDRFRAEAAPDPVGDAADASTPEARYSEPPQAVDLDVFPLAVERIMLDPGHGGSSTGTAGGGLAEKTIALDIGTRLRDLLADSFRVAMTREADLDVPLDQRTRGANRARADLFVSIHVNWLNHNPACGIETFYLGPTDDPELTALAESENSEAQGYSLGDLRRLLDGVYAQARQDESRNLATSVQTALVTRMRTVNPGLQDRGVKSAPFVVLIGAEMPAILAEVSCLSDLQEVERLRQESYRQVIAEALNAGIRTYAASLAETGGGSGQDPRLGGG